MIARNEKGKLGLVLGHHYDHSRGGIPFEFYGVGIRGGKWRSKGKPEFVASSIDAYVKMKIREKKGERNG